jgi:hypothetical protein
MRKHEKLVEETSLKDTTLGIKDPEHNITDINLPLNIKKDSNIISLIFRNQLSNDITLLIDKSKIITISDIIDILLSKLNVSQSDNIIRLFFKGRPLKTEEKINDISK